MSATETDKLIEKYLDGLTTPEEERRLAIAVNAPGASPRWKAVGMMLGEMTLAEALYEQHIAERRQQHLRHIARWAVAASLTGALILGTIGYTGRSKSKQEDVAVAYIEGYKIEDQNQVLALAEDAVCDIFATAAAEHDDDLSGIFDFCEE